MDSSRRGCLLDGRVTSWPLEFSSDLGVGHVDGNEAQSRAEDCSVGPIGAEVWILFSSFIFDFLELCSPDSQSK